MATPEDFPSPGWRACDFGTDCCDSFPQLGYTPPPKKLMVAFPMARLRHGKMSVLRRGST
jgi:hypothetical protein